VDIIGSRVTGREQVMSKVEVYGADWCEDTKRARQHLERVGVAYDYINIEQDKGASDWVKQQNDGKEKKPTIRVGGEVLTVPTEQELEDRLRSEGLIT
jgi:mycoredoxin